MIGVVVGKLIRRRFPASVVRVVANLWPQFRACGITIERISDDYLELDVSMALGFRNANFLGTHAGGPLYEMVDPFLVLMISANLGEGYAVWDKSAKITFVRPGTSKVRARFRLDAAEIARMREEADANGRCVLVRTITVENDERATICEVEKTVVVKRREGQQRVADRSRGLRASDQGQAGTVDRQRRTSGRFA